MKTPLTQPNPGRERLRYELRAAGVPFDAANPLRSGVHTRGYLPHVKREMASYFVTFRLADSLPQQVLLGFKRHQAEKLRGLVDGTAATARQEIERDYQRQVERYLDKGAGECFLRRAQIAQMVVDPLHFYEGKRYVLEEWVVMPNHAHLLIRPMTGWTLSQVLCRLKGYMGRQANLLLGKTGESFWQRESFDHWSRDEEEKAHIRRYIRNNPVIARLCRSPEQWRWSSAWEKAPEGNLRKT